jgi:hypothetical protein
VLYLSGVIALASWPNSRMLQFTSRRCHHLCTHSGIHANMRTVLTQLHKTFVCREPEQRSARTQA